MSCCWSQRSMVHYHCNLCTSYPVDLPERWPLTSNTTYECDVLPRHTFQPPRSRRLSLVALLSHQNMLSDCHVVISSLCSTMIHVVMLGNVFASVEVNFECIKSSLFSRCQVLVFLLITRSFIVIRYVFELLVVWLVNACIIKVCFTISYFFPISIIVWVGNKVSDFMVARDISLLPPTTCLHVDNFVVLPNKCFLFWWSSPPCKILLILDFHFLLLVPSWNSKSMSCIFK